MLKPRKAIAVSALIILAMTGSFLSAPASQAISNFVEGTDAAASVFDPLKVNNFSLEMSDADFESLKYPNVNWEFEGDWRETQMSFTMDGKDYGPYIVGVHLKGSWGSWRDVTQKAAFKIKMDAFVKDQTLFGISKFTLNNMVQDPSYIHETLTYRLYRALGVPTPRTGYANVTLNGIDYGLHLNVETMNKQLLSRWGISSSHLYKGAVPYFPDFYAGYESQFAIESGSTTDTSDLRSFIGVQALGRTAWWAAMGKIADMKQMTLGWATELYTGHWDGYVMNKNNYFLNFDRYGKVTLLPWGTDQTWNHSLSYFRAPTLMINKCWAVPACYAMYQESLAEVANKAEALDLENMGREVAEAISGAVSSDPFGPGYSAATSYQNSTFWRLQSQLSGLQTMSAPWDTGLASISVNYVAREIGSTVYLPAETRQIVVEAITNEYNATSSISNTGNLKDGLNVVSILVTSADKKHTSTKTLNLYVYTKKSTSSVVTFSKSSSKVTATGINTASSLSSKLTGSKQITLAFKMAKTKSLSSSKNAILLKQRADQVLKLLAAKGIKPTIVTRTLSSSGSPESITISTTYSN